MTRRFDRNTLISGMQLKNRLLKFGQLFSLSQIAPAIAELQQIKLEYQSLASTLQSLAEEEFVLRLIDACQMAVLMCEWITAVLHAEADSVRYLSAAKARALIANEELAKVNSFPAKRAKIHTWLTKTAEVQSIDNAVALVQEVGCFSLPIFYSRFYDPYASYRHKQEPSGLENPEVQNSTTVLPEPIVKVLFSIGGVVLSSPQVVPTHVQHDLDLKIQILCWPENFEFLKIDFLSTVDPANYSLGVFTFSEVKAETQIANQRAYLSFRVSQAITSEPMIFAVRARFMTRESSHSLPAVIIGHSELRLMSLDQASYPLLSHYPMIDAQLPKLLTEAKLTLPDISPEDFNDFTKCLIYLSRYAGMVQQTGIFKGKKILEKEFQQHLLQNLRMTELAAEVQEAEKTAGGIIDLRYRRIILELKVEDNISDRKLLREKYINQPTQYTVSSIPLSITCILDTSEKDLPPANVANNITLETPVVHGFENASPPYPSKVGVIIIDAYTKSPSDYS